MLDACKLAVLTRLAAKRYGQQIFLSLDVGALAPGGASIEFALLLMEKSLVVKLDSLLRK